MAALDGKKIAIIVHNYIEEPELVKPKQAFSDAGATVHILTTEDVDEVQTVSDDINMASKQPVDMTIDAADIESYDALIVPGGTINADNLRTSKSAQKAAQYFAGSNKPMAIICHGPWLLVSAGLADGKHLTSFKTLADDLRNAGANWVDEPVVVDGNLITSRNPDDIPAFNDAIIKALSEA